MKDSVLHIIEIKNIYNKTILARIFEIQYSKYLFQKHAIREREIDDFYFLLSNTSFRKHLSHRFRRFQNFCYFLQRKTITTIIQSKYCLLGIAESKGEMARTKAQRTASGHAPGLLPPGLTSFENNSRIINKINIIDTIFNR